ncbi:hypothetical protein CENSYa_2027 [Cenarchaeum symbiosum A]|uniref:Uncharacterized protein n=1 Tax=Cenarchaeum symbiosum (strain A) TaxID=414004 RepID=A0RZ63_CENSY|nr:hypothetical protein CENSYa_2027 [Cenarchaeum symbiosum A]
MLVLGAEEIDLYDAFGMVLLAGGGEPIGRTALQKLIYFCCNSAANIENADFAPQYYGPYSAKLSVVMERMFSCGYIEQIMRHGIQYDVYHYKLMDNGARLANKAKSQHPEDYLKIGDIVKTCDDMVEPLAPKLSYVSKIHYISKKQKARTPDKISLHGMRYGWNMDIALVREHWPLFEKFNEKCQMNPITH